MLTSLITNYLCFPLLKSVMLPSPEANGVSKDDKATALYTLINVNQIFNTLATGQERDGSQDASSTTGMPPYLTGPYAEAMDCLR
jgi:hypothetical protein